MVRPLISRLTNCWALSGRGPRVVVSTAAFHARVRGSVPGLGGLKETKMFLPHPRVKVSIVGSLRDREVACLASDRQGSNFESCVWRTVSSQSSHHPQEVLLAQFSLYVHKGGLKPDSFHFAGHYQCQKLWRIDINRLRLPHYQFQKLWRIDIKTTTGQRGVPYKCLWTEMPPNVVLMLDQRRRCWSNIETLLQHWVLVDSRPLNWCYFFYFIKREYNFNEWMYDFVGLYIGEWKKIHALT